MTKNKFYALNYCLFFCLVSLTSIFFSWSRLPTISPDSLGYLNFNPIRPSFYPIFLDILGIITKNKNFLIFAQVLIYISSFSYLIFIIHTYIKRNFLTFFVGILVSANFYMHSFHTTILTESVTFSVINIYICCLIKLFHYEEYSKVRNNIVFLGLLSGSLIGLKPAMITFIPCGFIVITVLALQKRKYLLKYWLHFFWSVSMILVIENVTYKSYHEERRSVSELILLGKTAILTTDEAFIYPENLNDEEKIILEHIDNFFDPYQKWLDTNPNPYVIRVLNSELEVLGQLSILKILNDRFAIPTPEKDIVMKIGKASLLTNTHSFFFHGITNYFEFWMVNSLSYALHFQDAKMPKFVDNDLNKTIPIKDLASINFSSAVFLIFFISLGILSNIIFLFFTILFLLDILKKRAFKKDKAFILLFLLIALSNILFVSFVNTPLTRYLMPNFAMLIIANVMFLDKLWLTIKKRLFDS